MSELFEISEPNKVTFGTIGPAGQRIFYLQARDERILVTLKIEKQQAGALAFHLGEALQDLRRPGHIPDDDSLALDAFNEETFVVGSIAVAYDDEIDRVVIVAQEAVEEDDDGSEARIAMTREQAAALAIRGTQLVESGRPPCPLCGYPLDPRGHACPRTNGHAAPIT
ncbi:MAG TPA: DUF3090 family protein [Acidimicrobiales bacterium]|nr:DUF3090 family protein [Acidimicrobiales bacterium]